MNLHQERAGKVLCQQRERPAPCSGLLLLSLSALLFYCVCVMCVYGPRVWMCLSALGCACGRG